MAEIENPSGLDLEAYEFITITSDRLESCWEIGHSELFSIVLDGEEISSFVGQIESIHSYKIDTEIKHQITLRKIKNSEFN